MAHVSDPLRLSRHVAKAVDAGSAPLPWPANQPAVHKEPAIYAHHGVRVRVRARVRVRVRRARVHVHKGELAERE
eukprot:scaffold44152_cov79-Phaeocystis_antarctica.AAC.1